MKQRELKFRVWDIYEKKMKLPQPPFIYQEILPFTDDNLGGGVGQINCNGEDHITFQGGSFILMQFTGLLAKNGKEIYEGDIVILGHDEKKEYPRQIIWKNHGFFCQQIKDKDICFPLTFCNAVKNYVSETDWEIIGNIYVNPELIK